MDKDEAKEPKEKKEKKEKKAKEEKKEEVPKKTNLGDSATFKRIMDDAVIKVRGMQCARRSRRAAVRIGSCGIISTAGLVNGRPRPPSIPLAHILLRSRPGRLRSTRTTCSLSKTRRFRI